MDNTELHYVTYDPEAIWDEMIANYVEAGGDLLYPGDEKEMLLRGVQADFVQLLSGVDNALRMHTLRYAVGDYLDILGELRGVDRIVAKQATTTVTITTNVTGEAITLEAGTQMTADGVIFYELVDDLALTGGEQTVTAEIICSRAGSIGNGLMAGVEMTLAGSDSDIKKAVNHIITLQDAAGGNERERDDPYRDRIREHGLFPVTTGPEEMYEAAAKNVSSEILDANAIKIGDGRVGVYLILENETGSAGIIRDVETALSAADVRPLTDVVKVYQATDIPYVLNVQYTSSASSSVSAAIAQAVADYQTWQDEKIGQPFNPDRLMASLYQAGATRVAWGEGSAFNGTGAVEYTAIADDERCKGTITLTEV